MKNISDFNKKNNSFTSQQLAFATGTSRSKILRIEDAGLISPADRTGSANARHYDIHTVLKLFDVLNYHNLGFTKAETVEFFESGGDCISVINELESRIAELSRVLTALKEKTDKGAEYVIREEDEKCLPCYAVNTGFDTAAECFTCVLSALGDAISSSCRIKYDCPIMITARASKENAVPVFYDKRILIPVEKIGTNKNITDYYIGKSAAMTKFGCYGSLTEMYDDFTKKLSGGGYNFSDEIMCSILSIPFSGDEPERDRVVLKISSEIMSSGGNVLL